MSLEVAYPMQNPFLFLSKIRNVDLLERRLQELGVNVLRVQDSDSAYVPAQVVLSHPSVAELAIVFHRNWWSDGTQQEDGKICLKVNGIETLVCDVSDMLRERFTRPLPDVLIEKLREAVAKAL